MSSSMQASVIRDATTRAPARPVGDQDSSARAQAKRIEDYIQDGQNTLRDYKKEIELLKQEISLMENHLGTQNDENVKVLNPFIMQNFTDLSNQISLQRTENDHLHRQLTELKREKSQVQQAIIQCHQKISNLEDQVGI